MAEEKPKYRKLKEYKIRKGRYPIRVSLTVWDDGKSNPFIDLYRGAPSAKGYKNEHFKIFNKTVWAKIKAIIDQDLIKGLLGKPISEKLIEKQVMDELSFLKEDNVRLKKTLQAQIKFIKEYRKNQLPEYRKDLVELKTSLNAKKEEELQSFLSKHTWLLGLEYENATPQKISVKSRYDFYVERYDGYADIIEIKKPTNNIFDKKGKLSAAFGKALQQLIEYIDEATYYGNSKLLSKKLDFNFLKPKGILIIGRAQDNEKLENLRHYFHNIEVRTYDDIYKRGETIIKNIEGGSARAKK